MNRVGIVVIAVVVIAVAAGGAFYAGTKVGENRVLQDPARLFQQRIRGEGGQFPGLSGTPPAAGQRGSLVMGGGTVGTIEALEGDTVVLSTEEGTIRVRTTDTTLIEKTMTVEVGELDVGEQVVVAGSRNDDGSLTARSIRSMSGFQFGQLDQP
jgi:hypothetical protein